ncbi:DUF2254 domain-containing protein [Hyphobacterium sp.]|uniref:DUF2254 domain-containing protein n=1 Tax=Hyphobacterium sp. TaxID=2004662 RepID=UPI00374974B1
MLNFHLRRIWRSIWFRPAAYAIAAVLAVIATPTLGRLLPAEWVAAVEADALATTLNILASSMLAVAIFSLATMFSAFQAAANAATPRARPLMTEDRTAQSAISTFVGAFLFSLLGLIGVTSGLYADEGLLVLFGLTLLLVLNVVVMLIRWIERLTEFGGVEEAISAIEAATLKAIERETTCPNLGARPLDTIPDDARPVHPKTAGYIPTIDIDALQALAETHGQTIHLPARPGDYVGPGQPVACITGSEDIDGDILEKIVIKDRRTIEEDPGFGLIAISEIASRALSASVNDPGTAISAIAANTRLMCALSASSGDAENDAAGHVYLAPLTVEGLMIDAYRAIARDAAGKVEVGIRLQKAMGMLIAANPDRFEKAARNVSQDALIRAEAAISHEADLDALRQACPD